MVRIKYPYKFDPKKRELAEKYKNGKLKLYFVSIMLSILTSGLILLTNFHITLDIWTSQLPFQLVFYTLGILLIFTVSRLPLTFYSSFMYEHKFNLSNYKIIGWLTDFAKMIIISYPLAILSIAILYFSINTFTPWWLYAGVLYIAVSTIMDYIYPEIIVPFMWKIKPYKDAKMKKKILDMCKKVGQVNIKKIVVIEESEKSSKPNAVFMGFGKTKSIGLFDTLLNSFTSAEIETVIGHELGHYVNKDMIKGTILEAIIVFPLLYITDYVIVNYGYIFGIPNIASLTSLVLIGLIYGFLEFLTMPIVNGYSRRMESAADKFALDNVRKPEAQISTERRLTDMHLSEVSAHPLIEFWMYSHPSTVKRIQMAEKWKKKKK